MIQVKFKNLEKSDSATIIALEKIEALVTKFDALKESSIIVSLEMENSQFQAGPDVFSASIFIQNGKFKNLKLRKKNSDLYKAIADLSAHLLESLNRSGDKKRVKNRILERRILKQNFFEIEKAET